MSAETGRLVVVTNLDVHLIFTCCVIVHVYTCIILCDIFDICKEVP